MCRYYDSNKYFSWNSLSDIRNNYMAKGYGKKTGGKILSSFNKRIAVMKTLPHLKSMHIAGEIETLLKDNIIDYKAA